MEKIFREIKGERLRQDAKFGVQNHSPIEWMAIIQGETGEAAREAVDHHFEYGQNEMTSFQAVQTRRLSDYRKELIQSAAVIVQAIQCLDRKGSLIAKDPDQLEIQFPD